VREELLVGVEIAARPARLASPDPHRKKLPARRAKLRAVEVERELVDEVPNRGLGSVRARESPGRKRLFRNAQLFAEVGNLFVLCFEVS